MDPKLDEVRELLNDLLNESCEEFELESKLLLAQAGFIQYLIIDEEVLVI